MTNESAYRNILCRLTRKQKRYPAFSAHVQQAPAPEGYYRSTHRYGSAPFEGGGAANPSLGGEEDAEPMDDGWDGSKRTPPLSEGDGEGRFERRQ